ncbi:hypothetical protein HA402_007226 [Bradysia odoriphaga]|nr:hypothetical protein HA402_007226 [Bradysia odoriphaga]
MKAIIIIAAILTAATASNSTPDNNQDSEKDDDTSRKIIGSSVVTSVSVIQNGEEPPKFSDAVGKPVPRPLVPPQVASPINLLNPDRYEFYTFNDSGDLVKRLMTMKEIQSIVAGGSNEGSVMHHMGSSNDKNFDDNVEDIVTSVQKVLNEEVEANKNTTNEHNVLDTPDVSSTWSIILPAIFGNTGDDIRPHKPQIVMTPDSVIVDATEKTAKKPVKVKPSNTGSFNKIEDPSEKKTAEKPTTAEEPIVHATKKKPVNTAFEASTPRSNIGGYQEHSIDEINSHHNNSHHGYRRKTTPAPLVSTTADHTKAPKPTRFVTRRPLTPYTQKIEVVTTTAPDSEDTTTEQSLRIPTKESTSEAVTEKATEGIAETFAEGFTEEATVMTTSVSDLDPLTVAATESTTYYENAELTTYKQEYDEPTTQQVAAETTTETETEHVEYVATTEHSTELFDSSNSFNQIVESLKDRVASESVEMMTEMNEAAASTIFDDVTTTESFMEEDGNGHATEKIPSIDVIQRINQSNVYLNEEMFVDEQEPLIYDIPTTTDFSIDTTEFNEDATSKDEDLTLPIFEEVKLQYPETSSIFEEKNPIVQQVDNFINENPAEVADSLAIDSTNNENKVANVVALDNLTLSEYIGQAATVASVLSNDADNMPIRTIMNQLILSPQLRHDELAPTTNIPAKFHEMEVLSLKKETSPVSSDNADDVSYETSVIKETSSISMSSKQPVVKLSKKPESANDAAKNEISSELFKMDSDASTEISVESDVHEEMNMIKMKIPAKHTVSSDSALNENKSPAELATTTEMNDSEMSTLNDESSTLSAQTTEHVHEEGTTVVAEVLADSVYTTEKPNIERFDQTTLPDDTVSASETTNNPTENQAISGNFVSDILNTIGMIDEDVIAQKFNISLSDEMEDEDISEMFNEGTTETDEMTTTKSKNEQTTMHNHYEEEIENEIIKRLQETLEERLNPKTDRMEVMETSYTTDSHIVSTTGFFVEATTGSFVETTTASPVEATTGLSIEATTGSPIEATTASFVRLEIITNKESETATESESVPYSTEENRNDLSQSEKIESATGVNDETDSSETTELSDALNDLNNNSSTDEANMNQDDSTTIEPTTGLYPKDEEAFIKLGETTVMPTTQTPIQSENDVNTHSSIFNVISSKKPATLKIDDRTSGFSKPSQHFRPHPTEQKLFYVNTAKPSLKMPPSTNTLKIKVSTSNRRPMPVKLDPAPKQALGLEQSTVGSDADILEFTKLCNELAFTFWKSLTSEGISSARSLVISPFALTSMLAMIFLGARGSTSGEMNEMLRLDDMVTFNPHLIFRNITDSVENTKDAGIANTAFVRELFSDRAKGKILSFYKDKAQQFYSGHVEEVNFNVINDVIRRRTNLLVKRHTWSKITEYIKTNNIWLNPPLAGLSANIFQTDCSKATVNERDGEMFFQVLPSIRQRRLVPIPAAVYKSGSGFMAGYDPEIDATAVAFGGTEVVSTIFVMPGQQGHSAPGDNLERLESVFMTNAVTNNAWRRLLTTLMPRQGLEVQIPRFSHRSFINATYGLQKMGLNELFNFDKADLRGLTGSTTKDMYISDMIQINTFSTCAEDKIGDQHHVELYPAPPIQKRNINYRESLDGDYVDASGVSADEERSLYDPLFDDQKYLELPLPLRPRQARIPEAPRLRFDKPFLYFVRHNPTGMILFMGRFNPRLLP